jgi:hypothetical protein
MNGWECLTVIVVILGCVEVLDSGVSRVALAIRGGVKVQVIQDDDESPAPQAGQGVKV